MHIDIDTIFTVVFVVGIILFQLFGTVLSRLVKKGKSAPSKQGKATQAGGLLQTLKSRVNRELQMALEQAKVAQAGSTGQSSRHEALVQTGKVRQPPAPVLRKAAPPVVDPVPDEEMLINEIRQGLLQETGVKVEETAYDAAPIKTYAVEDLRRAVIWSEILAPPLALRD